MAICVLSSELYHPANQPAHPAHPPEALPGLRRRSFCFIPHVGHPLTQTIQSARRGTSQDGDKSSSSQCDCDGVNTHAYPCIKRASKERKKERQERPPACVSLTKVEWRVPVVDHIPSILVAWMERSRDLGRF